MSFKPNDREVQANIEAYYGPPWGEDQTADEVIEYLNKMESDPRVFFYKYRDKPGTDPYLYVQSVNYTDNTGMLIEKEFTGENAYWRTSDKEIIEKALEGVDHPIYISNIYADKKAPISEANKPRLKVLPDILDKLFKNYSPDAIILFTHYDTGTFRAIEKLDGSKYKVRSANYKATESQATHNHNFKIDYLTIFVITNVK